MSNPNLLIDFDGFEGNGFANPPTPGQLHAGEWVVSETFNLARGLTTGGETAAGIYAYESQGDAALWIQPTGTYMTPGTLSLFIQNNTAAPINDLRISYDLLVLNDQDRASRFAFLFSEDNITFTPQAQLDFISPQASDINPQINTYPQGIALTGLNIPQGATFVLRWETDDFSGAGSRDEFGVDNIYLASGPPIIAQELRFKHLPTRLVAGQRIMFEVCATDASGQVAVGNASPIQLSEISATGASIIPGIQGAGCKSFWLIPSTQGPLSLRASNGVLPQQNSGPIPVDPGAVFISEYIEGSGSNRCIEVYNASGTAVNLHAEGYELRIYNNGSLTATPSDIYPLQGILEAGEVHVICNEHAGLDFLAQTDQTAPEPDFVFTGDDVIELRNAQTSLDFIGRLGEDPGIAWTGGGVSTENSTLVRKAAVSFGDNHSADAFDPSTQWISTPKNTWAYLGNHPNSTIATELRVRRFEGDSATCWSENDYIGLEVCAVDPLSGFTQTDFPHPIRISSSGIGPFEIAGLNGGTSLNVNENGCATFYVRNFHSETLRYTASAPGLLPVSTSSYTISPTCPAPQILQAVINPCGSETQNEFLSLLNGNTPLDLTDLTIASIDHLSGSPQPNYNYTFNATGTATPDNPKPCNTTDNVCLEWLDVNTPTQRQMLINLRDELNAISTCAVFEIPAQVPGTLGEIPAHARMMVFLGAGGNGTLGTEGFDDAANNLDFSSFCASGIQSIYVIAGTKKPGFGGYFHNQDARTLRLVLQGNTYDLQGSDPTGNQEAAYISHTGEYFDNQSCVPPTAFPSLLLPFDNFTFHLKTREDQAVQIFWEIQEEKSVQNYVIERKHDSEASFTEIAVLPSTGKTLETQPYHYLDLKPLMGYNAYRIRMQDFAGNSQYSYTQEVFIQGKEWISALRIFPQPAREYAYLSFSSSERTSVQIQIHNLAGQICRVHKYKVNIGNNRFEIPLYNLPSGYYLLEFMHKGMRLATHKMILR